MANFRSVLGETHPYLYIFICQRSLKCYPIKANVPVFGLYVIPEVSNAIRLRDLGLQWLETRRRPES